MKNCKTFDEAQTATGNYSALEIQKSPIVKSGLLG